MPLTQVEADALLEEFRELLARFTDPSDSPSGDLGEDVFLQEDDGAEDTPTPVSLAGYEVLGREVLTEGFEHRWPNRKNATLYRSAALPTAAYRLRTEAGEYTLLIGEEQGGRTTHGRPGRGRVVVFVRRPVGLTLYPLVEFAEADVQAADGTPLYAAGIPRAQAPRSLSTAEDKPALEQVAHLAGADIRRADEVYTGMTSGPSLRLVVPVTDVESMLAHGLWVGAIRGDGRLPRPA